MPFFDSGFPASLAGIETFSAAVSEAMRLYSWKTKPVCLARNRARLAGFIPEVTVPSVVTVPAVGSSRPAMQCSSVDLPDPDAPTTAVKLPSGKSASTWSSATTRASLRPGTSYMRVSCRTEIAGASPFART